jgi:hypothetical protein
MWPLFDEPLPYTADPLRLLLTEIWLFTVCSFPTPWNYLGLPSIVWPLWGYDSKYLDEIYPWSFGNVWAVFWHGILFLLQIGFLIGVPASAIIGLPFPPLLCTPAFIAAFIGFILVNQILCAILLNGPPARIFFSAGPDGVYAQDVNDPEKRLVPKDHPGERWVFINGVAVG